MMRRWGVVEPNSAWHARQMRPLEKLRVHCTKQNGEIIYRWNPGDPKMVSAGLHELPSFDIWHYPKYNANPDWAQDKRAGMAWQISQFRSKAIGKPFGIRWIKRPMDLGPGGILRSGIVKVRDTRGDRLDIGGTEEHEMHFPSEKEARAHMKVKLKQAITEVGKRVLSVD